MFVGETNGHGTSKGGDFFLVDLFELFIACISLSSPISRFDGFLRIFVLNWFGLFLGSFLLGHRLASTTLFVLFPLGFVNPRGGGEHVENVLHLEEKVIDSVMLVAKVPKERVRLNVVG